MSRTRQVEMALGKVPEILGVPEIDTDHQRIAAILDGVYAALIAHDRAVALEKLDQLIDVKCEHINHEDELMRGCRYTDAAAHRRDHDKIINMMSAIIVDYQTNNSRIVKDAAYLINIWRVEHIKRFDKPLAGAVLFLRESG